MKKKVDKEIDNLIYAVRHSKDATDLIPAMIHQYHFTYDGALRFIKTVKDADDKPAK